MFKDRDRRLESDIQRSVRSSRQTRQRKTEKLKYIDQYVTRGSSSAYFKKINTHWVQNVERIESRNAVHNMWTGHGLKIWKDKYNKFNMALDNLWVRENMFVWELILSQLSVISGITWFTDGAKVAEVDEKTAPGAGGDDYIRFELEDGTDGHPFAVNDLIMAKVVDIQNQNVLYTKRMTVVDASPAAKSGTDWVEVSYYASDTKPNIGDTLARVGNTTDTDRQGGLFAVATFMDDEGTPNPLEAPYFEVYDGITSFVDFGDLFTALSTEGGSNTFTKVRMGKLDGLGASYAGDYGMYGSVIHLKGSGGSGYSATYTGTANPNVTPPTTTPMAGDTYWETDAGILWRYNGLTWVQIQAFINENGKIINTAAPSGTGFFADATQFGLYRDGDWRVYFDTGGDMHLGSAAGDAFQYDYSNNTVLIKTAQSGTRIEFDGTNSRLRFGNSTSQSDIEPLYYNPGSGFISGIDITGSLRLSQQLDMNNSLLMADQTKIYFDKDGDFGTQYANNFIGTYVVGTGLSIGLMTHIKGGVGDGGIYLDSNIVYTSNDFDVGGSIAMNTGETIKWNADTTLQRAGAGILQSPGNFILNGAFFVGGATSGSGAINFDSGTTIADGIQWGSDTALYRSGANILYTPDTFFVGSDLKINGSGQTGYTDPYWNAYTYGSSPNTQTALNWYVDYLWIKGTDGLKVDDDIDGGAKIDAATGFRYNGTDGLGGSGTTYTFGGGSTGDIASMTFKGGILTAVTTVP